MQIVYSDKSRLILRLDKGDDFFEIITDFFSEKDLESAFFNGLGACESVTLSYYNLRDKKYQDRVFSDDLEILSLTGNITSLNNKPIAHVHGVFGDDKYRTYGGHVKKLIVSGTCELQINILNKKIDRLYDTKTGLNLMCETG